MSAFDLLLRRMTLEDVDRVHEIDQASFSLPWSRRSFLFELQESLVSSSWVAEYNGEVIAMIVTWLIDDEAHVATFAVHPDWRGHGVGRRLLGHALHEAWRRGCTHVALEVRAGNQEAIPLYHSFGFVQVGVRPGYYHDTQEDALLMDAPLPPPGPGAGEG
jgi:[ribosomal protein S18]-alanine N-acetyltransferase